MHTPFHRAQSGAVRGCGGTGSVAHGLYPRPAMGPIWRLSPPLARNLPTKTGSETLPPDTAALQGPEGETFQHDACDGFAAIPKTCLPRHTHTDGKQQAAVHTMEASKAGCSRGCTANKAMLQEKKKNKKESCKWGSTRLWSHYSLLCVVKWD